MMDRIGARARLAADDARSTSTRRATLRGANFVGSPEEVATKILFQHELFGHERFLIQFSVGTLPHEQTLKRSSSSARGWRRSCARRSAAAALLRFWRQRCSSFDLNFDFEGGGGGGGSCSSSQRAASSSDRARLSLALATPLRALFRQPRPHRLWFTTSTLLPSGSSTKAA